MFSLTFLSKEGSIKHHTYFITDVLQMNTGALCMTQQYICQLSMPAALATDSSKIKYNDNTQVTGW